MSKIGDKSGDTVERKNTKHHASEHGGVTTSEDSQVISKQEKTKQDVFNSNDSLKTPSLSQAEQHRSLQIVDGDKVLLDSHKKKSGPNDGSDHTHETNLLHDKDLGNVKQLVENIRNSGILNAPGRTGSGDVEYKMVVYKDGSASKAFKNQFVGKDPVTHSDVFATHPDLTKEILLKTFTGKGIATLIHSHPNKPGMEPYAFSKEDIAESNASGANSILLGPDGRVFLHKANPDGKLMDPAHITDDMRKPDRVLGKFDAKGNFHPAKQEGKNIVFEDEAI